jgi:23S rRNA G2445 N2-methylase RlmL
MVFNPPYDERLDIHGRILQNGDTLKKNYPGTNAWFITETGSVKICRIKSLRLNYSTCQPVLSSIGEIRNV